MPTHHGVILGPRAAHIMQGEGALLRPTIVANAVADEAVANPRYLVCLRNLKTGSQHMHRSPLTVPELQTWGDLFYTHPILKSLNIKAGGDALPQLNLPSLNKAEAALTYVDVAGLKCVAYVTSAPPLPLDGGGDSVTICAYTPRLPVTLAEFEKLKDADGRVSPRACLNH